MAELHVVSTLKEKRAELSGSILNLERQIAFARSDLLSVDRVLKLFAPDLDTATIPPKQHRKRDGLFEHAELPRLVLDVVRRTGRPVEAVAVATAAISAKGLDPTDRRLLALVTDKVSRTLSRLRIAGIVALEQQPGQLRPVWRLVG